MPTNPTIPPSGKYSSQGDTDSSWDGTFTYDNKTKAISYTRDNPPNGPFSATNQDNGNALNFKIDDGTEIAHFVAQTFAWKGDKAEYKGKWNVEGRQTQDGWTATQSS